MRNEREFVEKLEADSPHLEKAKWEQIIHKSAQLSHNAQAAVLESICNGPGQGFLSIQEALALVNQWQDVTSHDHQDLMVSFARAIIEESSVDPKDIIFFMRRMASVPGSYAALNVSLKASQNSEWVRKIKKEITDDWASGC